MGFSLGEPERIYNIAYNVTHGWKIMPILLHILKRSETWKRYMGFSLGEPERIYNIAYNITHGWKNMSILLYILKRSETWAETLHGLQPGWTKKDI